MAETVHRARATNLRTAAAPQPKQTLTACAITVDQVILAAFASGNDQPRFAHGLIPGEAREQARELVAAADASKKGNCSMSATVVAMSTAAGAPNTQQRRRGPRPSAAAKLSDARWDRRQAEQRAERFSDLRQSVRSMLTLMAIERRDLLLLDVALGAKRRAEFEQRQCAGVAAEAELLSEIEALQGVDGTVSALPARDNLSRAHV